MQSLAHAGILQRFGVQHVTGMTVALLEDHQQRRLAREAAAVQRIGWRAEQRIGIQHLVIEQPGRIGQFQVTGKAHLLVMPAGDVLQCRAHFVVRVVTHQLEREPPAFGIEQQRWREVGALPDGEVAHRRDLAIEVGELLDALGIEGDDLEVRADVRDQVRPGEVLLHDRLAVRAVLLPEIDDQAPLARIQRIGKVFLQVIEARLEPLRILALVVTWQVLERIRVLCQGRIGKQQQDRQEQQAHGGFQDKVSFQDI